MGRKEGEIGLGLGVGVGVGVFGGWGVGGF